jgi:ribosomal protein S18 acetylase RimI-like enzyme
MVIEEELVGLYDIFTAPDHRGAGLGRAVCLHLLQRARGQGASCAYLQVDADNDPARRLYAGLGFSDGYAYHYRTASPQEAL